MMTDNSSTTEKSLATERQASLTWEPATLLIAGVLLSGWLWLGFGWRVTAETLSLPFVCADVAAVALLCAMPAAITLASLFRRRGTMSISAVVSISILAAAVLMTVDSQWRGQFVSDRTLVANGYWLRPAIATTDQMTHELLQKCPESPKADHMQALIIDMSWMPFHWILPWLDVSGTADSAASIWIPIE